MAIPVEHKPAAGVSLATSGAQKVSGIQAVALGVLLVAAFWPIVLGIYGSWFDERSYMEHGILVVPAAAYMAWAKRDKLAAVIPRPSIFLGVSLLAWGTLQALLGAVGQWVWVSRMAFLISFVGAIALVYGFRMIRELTYPLCTLLLMIAPPDFIFQALTLRLQLLASRL